MQIEISKVERIDLGPGELLAFTIPNDEHFNVLSHEITDWAKKIGLAERILVLTDDISLSVIGTE